MIRPPNQRRSVFTLDLNQTNNVEDSPEITVAKHSIVKRLQFCDYHYYEILDLTNNPTTLVMDVLGDGLEHEDDKVTIRTKYEAHFYAFVQSLLALIDSLPYLLYLYQPVNLSNKINIGWNKKFLGKYKAFSYFKDLQEFYINEQFNILKGLVNKSKHATLTNISNDLVSLNIESFDYKLPESFESKEKVLKKSLQQNLITYIKDSHNQLIQKYSELFEEIIAYKADQLDIDMDKPSSN